MGVLIVTTLQLGSTLGRLILENFPMALQRQVKGWYQVSLDNFAVYDCFIGVISKIADVIWPTGCWLIKVPVVGLCS